MKLGRWTMVAAAYWGAIGVAKVVFPGEISITDDIVHGPATAVAIGFGEITLCVGMLVRKTSRGAVLCAILASLAAVVFLFLRTRPCGCLGSLVAAGRSAMSAITLFGLAAALGARVEQSVQELSSGS